MSDDLRAKRAERTAAAAGVWERHNPTLAAQLRERAEIDRLRQVAEAARVWFNSAGMEPEHAEAIAALREAVAATHFIIDFSDTPHRHQFLAGGVGSYRTCQTCGAFVRMRGGAYGGGGGGGGASRWPMSGGGGAGGQRT